jgi:hypothetical protein
MIYRLNSYDRKTNGVLGRNSARRATGASCRTKARFDPISPMPSHPAIRELAYSLPAPASRKNGRPQLAAKLDPVDG